MVNIVPDYNEEQNDGMERDRKPSVDSDKTIFTSPSPTSTFDSGPSQIFSSRSPTRFISSSEFSSRFSPMSSRQFSKSPLVPSNLTIGSFSESSSSKSSRRQGRVLQRIQSRPGSAESRSCIESITAAPFYDNSHQEILEIFPPSQYLLPPIPLPRVSNCQSTGRNGQPSTSRLILPPPPSKRIIGSLHSISSLPDEEPMGTIGCYNTFLSSKPRLEKLNESEGEKVKVKVKVKVKERVSETTRKVSDEALVVLGGRKSRRKLQKKINSKPPLLLPPASPPLEITTFSSCLPYITKFNPSNPQIKRQSSLSKLFCGSIISKTPPPPLPNRSSEGLGLAISTPEFLPPARPSPTRTRTDERNHVSIPPHLRFVSRAQLIPPIPILTPLSSVIFNENGAIYFPPPSEIPKLQNHRSPSLPLSLNDSPIDPNVAVFSMPDSPPRARQSNGTWGGEDSEIGDSEGEEIIDWRGLFFRPPPNQDFLPSSRPISLPSSPNLTLSELESTTMRVDTNLPDLPNGVELLSTDSWASALSSQSNYSQNQSLVSHISFPPLRTSSSPKLIPTTKSATPSLISSRSSNSDSLFMMMIEPVLRSETENLRKSSRVKINAGRFIRAVPFTVRASSGMDGSFLDLEEDEEEEKKINYGKKDFLEFSPGPESGNFFPVEY